MHLRNGEGQNRKKKSREIEKTQGRKAGREERRIRGREGGRQAEREDEWEAWREVKGGRVEGKAVPDF